MNRRLWIILSVVLGAVAVSAFFWVPPLLKPQAHVAATAMPPSTPTPLAEIEIEVLVLDAQTAKPVHGAMVTVEKQSAGTDNNGKCTLQVKNGSSHTLEVTGPRYQEGQETLIIEKGTKKSIAVQIDLAPTMANGTVTGHNDRPLNKAQLVFAGNVVPIDAEGEFVAYRVADGDALEISHPGYASLTTTYDGTSLNLVMSPLSTTVQVYDAITGQTLEGAEICPEQDNGRCEETIAGVAILHEIADPSTLSILHSSYLSSTAHYTGQTTLELSLTPRELSGIIRDEETGKPLTNTVLHINGEVVPLDEQGHYYLPDLTQVYTMFVKTPGYKLVTIPFDENTNVRRYDALDACLEPRDGPCADINMTPFAVHGIYVNFNLLMWGRDRVLDLIDMVDRSPILNAIVIDIKSDRGFLAFETDDPIVTSGQAMFTPKLSLPEFLALCEERNIYTIARMVIFKDNALIEARPELAVRHPNGEIFYDREGMAWADPTRPETWEYNIAISREAIKLGFDEIQYDYLRYPSDSTSLAVVRALIYSIPYSLESRVGAISGFLATAQEAIDETPAFLSADIFGFSLVVQPDHDMRIGQRLMDIGPIVDYVCPMIYPSTFIPGNLGLASPPDEPYQVIEISMGYGMARTNAMIRPWLQHYWYDRYEIAEQRRAAEAANDAGWCYWNAAAEYDELFFVPPEGLEPN